MIMTWMDNPQLIKSTSTDLNSRSVLDWHNLIFDRPSCRKLKMGERLADPPDSPDLGLCDFCFFGQAKQHCGIGDLLRRMRSSTGVTHLP
jgi:hypothetical protein